MVELVEPHRRLLHDLWNAKALSFETAVDAPGEPQLIATLQRQDLIDVRSIVVVRTKVWLTERGQLAIESPDGR